MSDLSPRHFTQKIQVDGQFNVTVTTSPGKERFEAGDLVTLTSDSDDTTIEFTETSPFAEIPAKQSRTIGKSSGPYEILDTPKQPNHFDCGRHKDGKFDRWGGGGGTPSGSGL